tara:strand:- start:1889 stop:2206 length:318 start_codon:yes stop_codon:yes gene_type:complete
MKIFNATCAAGIVKVDNKIVVDCPILGEGGESSGFLAISGLDLVYLPKTTPDVKALIILIESLCDKIQALTVISSSPGSPSGAPINAADFAEVKTELTTLKDALK